MMDLLCDECRAQDREQENQTLPRHDRFEAENYFSVGRGSTRWRWTYEMDSGEKIQGTAKTFLKAKQAAEKRSGERIR
jgi:hypothetical protein